MSSIRTESLSTRNENGMESLSKLIQLNSSTVLAGAPATRLLKSVRDIRNGISTITDANTPAVDSLEPPEIKGNQQKSYQWKERYQPNIFKHSI